LNHFHGLICFKIEKERIFIQAAAPEGGVGSLSLLWRDISVLLALPVRVCHLHGLHAGKSVGNEL
jgi:hypothetical protein